VCQVYIYQVEFTGYLIANDEPLLARISRTDERFTWSLTSTPDLPTMSPLDHPVNLLKCIRANSTRVAEDEQKRSIEAVLRVTDPATGNDVYGRRPICQ